MQTGVGDQVDAHLMERIPITDERAGHRWSRREVIVRRLEQRRRRPRRRRRSTRCRTGRELQAPALIEPGEGEEIPDESPHPCGFAWIRVICLPTDSGSVAAPDRYSSEYPAIVEIGVRSSCDASAANCFTRFSAAWRSSNDIWRRSSIVFSESVSRPISGSGVICIARRSMSPSAIASAVSTNSSYGRRLARSSSQKMMPITDDRCRTG